VTFTAQGSADATTTEFSQMNSTLNTFVNSGNFSQQLVTIATSLSASSLIPTGNQSIATSTLSSVSSVLTLIVVRTPRPSSQPTRQPSSQPTTQPTSAPSKKKKKHNSRVLSALQFWLIIAFGGLFVLLVLIALLYAFIVCVCGGQPTMGWFRSKEEPKGDAEEIRLSYDPRFLEFSEIDRSNEVMEENNGLNEEKNNTNINDLKNDNEINEIYRF
jgi:hypothetical protein